MVTLSSSSVRRGWGCTWPSGSPDPCRCSRWRRAKSPQGHYDHRIEHRGGRRVRRDDRGVQRDGRGVGLEPAPSGARGGRPRAQEPGGRRPPALHRGGRRAGGHRRRLDRSGRPHRHHQPAAHPCSSTRSRPSGTPAVDVFGRPTWPRSTRCSTRRRARAAMPSRRRWPSCVRRPRAPRRGRRDAADRRDAGEYEGSVLVLDDVTPLIRAQKVAAWREVARRLAHEIKNPLTPIQLSAERLRASTVARTRAGAGPGVHDDDHRRGGVAQGPGGRVLAVRADAGAPCGADRPAPDAPRRLALYDGLFAEVPRASALRTAAAVRVDPEQIKRVIINLVDNAIEAMDRRGTIVIETGVTRPTAGARDRRGRRWPRHPRGRAREAVPAVLLDQGPRQWPRPRDCPAHRRRARRLDRSGREHAARHPIHHRAAG
jgi:hypothetical protein